MTMNNKQKRAYFKNRKRNGDITKLVKSFKGEYSQPHISNVLAGRRNNERILNKATQLVARRKATA
jgi:hypothetical protein